MTSPYIFGHRGGMGHCIENTISCFKKAVELGVGIECDVQLTKDNTLICFHDYFITSTSRRFKIGDVTLEQLNNIEFEDGRNIPTVKELFETFSNQKNDLRYSFDIRGKEAGQKLIDLAIEYQILQKIEITERDPFILKDLRNYNKDILLVQTLNESIRKITIKNVNFSKLRQLAVKAINLKGRRANFENLKIITDNNLECYAWHINKESIMKNILKLRYKDRGIAAIYTDYPKVFLRILNRIQS